MLMASLRMNERAEKDFTKLECFEQLQSSWKKCIFVQGKYVEGNVAVSIVLCVFFRNNMIQEHFAATT